MESAKMDETEKYQQRLEAIAAGKIEVTQKEKLSVHQSVQVQTLSRHHEICGS
ncbi:hypothetical protein CRENBAI_002797 [Crenichthys baileyi]|uniref:Uncharacterized protein n=1 Tax=Crenichthys baileyi TaxID=28760 RepID=A0AAV9SFH9_9TELE